MLLSFLLFFFFNDTATTEIYTLSLHDALPISPLGLRRVRRNHGDPQLRAHAPKLRDRLFSAQPLFRRGRALVQVLPIHVQRQRHPVALDPRAQRIGHRPDRLLLAEGLWSRQRKRRHRRRRERKEHFGEMVQMDGRFPYWLEERGPQG